ncbi:hypothetical protein CCY99_04225 [Helicobacter sp. 16-1353]|uniref:glycosyltransferase n=1 Tax=Helicobacter sp. 16-1353 TaxID=2004996 RepID=UPI000DCF00AE|nr:glycosyltransferase [Helicobacter sp. 16-1353]RAX54224.1 hypothetical protein CCY99_04225 [Helicobacter sp. 16-1353]
MRVLQFGKFFPPDLGGIETVIEDLTLGLNKRGISCDVLCSNSKLKYEESTLPCGAKIMRCASFGKFASTSIAPQMIFKLRKIIDNYDIIHMHLPDPMANLALLLANYKNKIIILHWHSDIIKQKRLLKLYLPLQQKLLKIATAIIATSNKYIEESAFLPKFRDKCVGIPIGVNKESLVADDVDKDIIRFPKNKKVIFSLGRFATNKGFEYLIESAKYLSDEYVIFIGGSGNEALKKQFEEQVRAEGLENKVYLMGRIKRNNLQYYYKNCHIFALPSIQESYGIVLVEAMSFGKPIICTKLYPSGNDWINMHNKTGLVIESKNPQAIAKAIEEIEKNYNYFANNAYNRYLEEFKQETMIDNIISLYKKLLKNGRI